MADQQCPCKQKLSEGEKGILNFGLSSEMLKNPNAAAIGVVRQLGGSNGNRLATIIGNATANPPLPYSQQITPLLPSLTALKDKIDQQSGIVNVFEAECNRMTDPQYLTSVISSLSLYGELSCALGIEGLDIGVGLNVVNQNGQLSIQAAVAANVNIEKILNQFDSGLGTDVASAVQSLQSGLDGAFAAIDQVNNAINGVMAEAAAIQNKAADFIRDYTNISSLANLVNNASTDPCFKLGSTLNGSLVSPGFLNVVRGGTPTGFGTTR